MTEPREYGEPTGRRALDEESARDLEILGKHIDAWWGEVPEVFHEIESDYVHIDLHITPATQSRPYHSVVTTGMSDRPMMAPDGRDDCRHCELVMALPPDWPIEKGEFDDERHWWPFRQLKQTARFPHVHETWLWYSHTIANENPPEPFHSTVQFCGGILSIPMLCPKEAWKLEVREGKTVNFLAFIPLYESELRHAWESGSNSLFEKLDELEVSELIDPVRSAAV